MAMTIHVDIVSAEGEIHSGVASMVYAPAEMGEVGISPRHSPMITRLTPGDVRVESEPAGAIEHYYVSGGMLEVQPHVVTILADTAIRAHDLDEAAAGCVASAFGYQGQKCSAGSRLIVVEDVGRPAGLQMLDQGRPFAVYRSQRSDRLKAETAFRLQFIPHCIIAVRGTPLPNEGHLSERIVT